MIYNNLFNLIGNTPMIKINKLLKDSQNEIYVKLEKFNLGGSVKDRAVLGMIEDAEIRGVLKQGDYIIEPTSGNTGIALAMIGKIKGYKVIITMPESMSKERRDIIKSYGAELILTEGSKGIKGSILKAEELVKDKGYFMLSQFDNLSNAKKHYETTGEEILKEVSDIDIFIAGIGTGGTISGVGKKLKETNRNTLVIGVEPFNSAVLSGEKVGSHKIQGIGAGFIPKIFDKTIVDYIVKVKDEDALDMTKRYANEEGILVGISSGAAIYVALEISKKVKNGKKIVVIAPDGGEKYISTGVYD